MTRLDNVKKKEQGVGVTRGISFYALSTFSFIGDSGNSLKNFIHEREKNGRLCERKSKTNVVLKSSDIRDNYYVGSLIVGASAIAVIACREIEMHGQEERNDVREK